MAGHLRPYKSYVFKTKDPVIDVVRTAVQASGMSYAEIHQDSGVSTRAMWGWFNGPTRRPQFATINAVARACGKEFVLQDKKPNGR